MKKCNMCNKEYDDSKMFCPVCGSQLTPVTPAPTPTPTPSKAAVWFGNWGGALLTLLGFVVAWEFHILLGISLVVLGIIFAWSSSNKVNKILSVVLAVITVVLSIWALI